MAHDRPVLPSLAIMFTVLSAPPLAAQPGTQVICDEIRQRYVVNQSQLNTRILNFLFFDAAERGCLALAKQFLREGASIEARDRFGNTGLLLAARTGENKTVAFLLEQGSAVNHQNLAGSTALLRAASMNRRRTVKILIEAGGDPNLRNQGGLGPLTAAAFNGNERLVTTLLKAGADPGATDATGKGPIVYAAGKGFAGILGTLLDAGVDANARYENDLTALMWAAGHSNDVPATEGLAALELLLARGARHDLADNRGRTALMIAAERGHSEIVAHLIEVGANRATTDIDGKTAFDLAANDLVRRALRP